MSTQTTATAAPAMQGQQGPAPKTPTWLDMLQQFSPSKGTQAFTAALLKAHREPR